MFCIHYSSTIPETVGNQHARLCNIARKDPPDVRSDEGTVLTTHYQPGEERVMRVHSETSA